MYFIKHSKSLPYLTELGMQLCSTVNKAFDVPNYRAVPYIHNVRIEPRGSRFELVATVFITPRDELLAYHGGIDFADWTALGTFYPGFK